MAEHVAKTYSCDRCGCIIEEPAKVMHVSADRHGEWAPEFDVDWSDFCGACDKAVTDFFTMRVSK